MNAHRTLVSAMIVAHGLTGISHAAIGQSQPASGPAAQPTPRWTTGSISLQVGTAGLGLSQLNGSLTANGRPAFSKNVATIGVSGYARFGRLLIGGGGESALPQRQEAAGWVNKVSFGSAMLDAGYVMIDGSRLTVYPQLSIGIRGTSLKVQRTGDFTYEDGVRDPARGVEMSSLSALAGAGFVAETHLVTRRTGAFSIGVRAGMVKPLGAPGTLYGESTVSGAPREESGWNVRLAIGKPIGNRSDIVSAISTAVVSILSR